MDIFTWIIGEAGAAWIFGILGLFGLIYTWTKRERPPKIVIQELKKTRLYGSGAFTNDSINVFVRTSNGEEFPIRGLIQREYALYNSGTQDILESVCFSLVFESKDIDRNAEVFAIGADSPDCVIEAQNSVDKRGLRRMDCRFDLPYLNSFAKHKHYVRVYVISESDILIRSASGMGKGWSAHTFSPSSSLGEIEVFYSSLSRIVFFFSFLMVVFGTTLFIYGAFKYGTLGTLAPAIITIIKPSPEIIEAYLASERQRLELLRTLNWWEAILMPLTVSSSLSTLAFGTALSIFGLAVRQFQNQIATYVLGQLFGVQPNSSFKSKD